MSSVLIRRLMRPSAKGKCWLVIQQGQQKPTFWALTHAKIEECDDLPENAWPVFSLSSQDLRVLAEKPVSAQRAKSLIRQQCGQASRAINHSGFGAVYGRALMSMPSSYAMTPATILVDAMLRERGWPKQPFVVAWLLTVENSENQILSLWSGTGRGDLTDVQATENAHDADPIVESYCASHGIEPGADNFIAFSLDEVFDAASRYADRLYAYPDFEDWHGWPIDSLWRTSAAVAAGLAVIGLANVAWHTVRFQWLERSQNSEIGRAHV